MNVALLIVDMQVGARTMDNPKFHRMNAVIETIAALIGKARRKNIPVFYAQHHNPNGFPLYGSEEWQIIPELAPRAEEVVVHKTTPDPFMNTFLHAHLQKNGIKKLIVAGIQTADCVDTTCRVAFHLGYEVVLVQDGHTTFDTPIGKAEWVIAHHNQVIKNWFGKVVESEAIEF